MITIDTCDPLARLPALAARLRVSPIQGPTPASVLLITHDGRKYDLFDLVHALLNRLDEARLTTQAHCNKEI